MIRCCVLAASPGLVLNIWSPFMSLNYTMWQPAECCLCDSFIEFPIEARYLLVAHYSGGKHKQVNRYWDITNLDVYTHTHTRARAHTHTHTHNDISILGNILFQAASYIDTIIHYNPSLIQLTLILYDPCNPAMYTFMATLTRSEWSIKMPWRKGGFELRKVLFCCPSH